MGKYFCLAQDPHPTLSSVLIIAVAVFRKHVEVPARELRYLSDVISGCSGLPWVSLVCHLCSRQSCSGAVQLD